MVRKRRGRGEGSIFQRADGLWTASLSLGYSETGKRQRKVIYGDSKQGVQEQLRNLQNDAANGKLADAGMVTVAAYLRAWLETTARPRIAPKTALRYEQIIRLRINPVLGGVRLSKLGTEMGPLHVKQLFAVLHKNGVSARGQQMTGTLLHTALRDAVKDRLLPFNPASGVSKPKPAHAEMKVWDRSQVKRFLTMCQNDRLGSLYVVAVDTGMRQGELFALRWQDVDFNTGSIQIQHSLEEINGSLRLKETKSGKGRRIELSSSASNALQRHRTAMVAEGHCRGDVRVFCDVGGGWLRKGNVLRRSYWSIIRRVNNAAEQAPANLNRPAAVLPKIRFHDLRHTCASLLLLAGVHPKVVQERLGHAKIEITLNLYSHLLPGIQKEAADRMNTILGAIA